MNACVRPAWSSSSCGRATGPRSPPAHIRTRPHGCRWRGRPLRWCTAGWPCGWRSASPCSRSTSAPSRRPFESTWKRGKRLISENADQVSAPSGAFGFWIVGQVEATEWALTWWKYCRLLHSRVYQSRGWTGSPCVSLLWIWTPSCRPSPSPHLFFFCFF